MIALKKVSYNIGSRDLFLESNVNINNNEVTVIYGESGTGKSTLLGILSLEIPMQSGEYYFDTFKINDLTIEESTTLKRQHILYIRQDEMFIKKYTLKENACLLLEARDQILDVAIFKQLLTKVGIDINKIDKPLANLSNGELQRFSVVCACMIDANLYIFDEPTSSLDVENSTIVVSMIEKIASKGKMVIVSMHDDKWFKNAHAYIIEDQEIKEVRKTQSSNEINEFTINDNCIKNKLIFKEGMNLFSHSPILNTILIIILSFVIGLSSIFSTFGHQLVPIQKDLLEGVYDNELFLVNYTEKVANFADYDSDFFLSIPKEMVTQIQNVDHVAHVYPNQYLQLQVDYFVEVKERPNILNEEKYKMITLLENDKEVISQSYDEDLLMTYLEVDSVYPHHRIKERCEYYDDSVEEGFYITSYLAQKLGITELNHQTLSFYMTIPVASVAGVAYDSNDNPSVLVRGMFSVLDKLELPIKGILKETTMNSYTINPTPNIYLDYDIIQSIIDNANEENKDWIEERAKKETEIAEIKQFWPYELMETAWNPSAYIIVVDDLEYVDEVRSNLQKINESFYIRGFKANGQITQDMVEQQKMIFYGFSAAIIVVVAITSFIIGYFKKRRNNKYYDFLYHIGFELKNIHKVQKIDNMFIAVLIIPFAILFSIIINRYLNFNIQFDSYYVVMLVTQSLFVLIFMGINRYSK